MLIFQVSTVDKRPLPCEMFVYMHWKERIPNFLCCKARRSLYSTRIAASRAQLGTTESESENWMCCAVKKGDRIAQLILERIMTPEVEEVEDLDATLRGSGGYGSTGVAS